MPVIGTLTFDAVEGLVPPLTTKRVQPVENPGLVPAVVRLPLGPPGQLTYTGWFATPVAATIFALVGTTVSADDEAGTTTTVMVNAATPTVHQPALGADGSTLGWLCVLTVEVQAWA